MSTKGLTEADRHANARAYYSDIFYLPHREPSPSSKHPRMSMEKRAAIFASFDALVGFKETVTETARTTSGKTELSEGETEELNRRLSFLIERMDEENDNGGLPQGIIRAGENPPTVKVTYFKPDERKDGGAYITLSGKVVKIDMYQKIMAFDDGKIISLDAAVKFEGDIFKDMW